MRLTPVDGRLFGVILNHQKFAIMVLMPTELEGDGVGLIKRALDQDFV